MLYWIYQLWKEAQESGADWAETFSFLRILGYISVRAGLATLIAFMLTLLIGERVIRKLISMKVGQPLRTAEEVHKLAELHGGKAGTPTMGGIMILGTTMVAILVCGRILNPFVLVVAVVTLALGVLGFLDDYQKVAKNNSEGVSGKLKLGWQAVVDSRPEALQLQACAVKFFSAAATRWACTLTRRGAPQQGKPHRASASPCSSL